MQTEMDIILDAVKTKAGLDGNADYEIEAVLDGVIIDLPLNVEYRVNIDLAQVVVYGSAVAIDDSMYNRDMITAAGGREAVAMRMPEAKTREHILYSVLFYGDEDDYLLALPKLDLAWKTVVERWPDYICKPGEYSPNWGKKEG